jgi:hypothetical protein
MLGGMPNVVRYVLLTAALAALIFGPLAVWYRQEQRDQIQTELAASIGQLTDKQIQSCKEGFDLEDERFKTQWSRSCRGTA